MLFTPGCEAQGFFLLSSFASPLLHLIKDPSAVLVSIYGAKKSGISTTISAAGSVWGKPRDYMVGMEADDDRYRRLKALNPMPAMHDTLIRHDPAMAHRYLRHVMAQDVAKAGLWRGTFLAISPVSLFGILDGTDRPWPRYGVEFKMSVPKDLQMAGLEKEFLNNTGHAGVKFTEYLVDPLARQWARQQIILMRSRIEDENDLDKEKDRYPQTAVAVVHVAGVICARLGLLDIDAERVSGSAASLVFPRRPAPASDQKAHPA